MIELSRPQLALSQLRIKVFGLGGAGCNALDRVALDGALAAELFAINTDGQALMSSIVENKLQIGRTITRGLGAGGDPEVGRAAAEDGNDEIVAALSEANIVFLLVGLGGGTGSGAAPIIAELAREQNAMIVVFATLPFQFEGKRRMVQALESLSALHQLADIVVCFENDRMGEVVLPKASVQDAFAITDVTIGRSVRAMAAMACRRGPVHVGFDEVASVVRGEHSRALFGYGEAKGDNRAHEALDAALKCPLLDRGRRLRESEDALVQIAGGADLTLNEIQIVMEAINRHIPAQTRLFFGAVVDPNLAGRLSVTILSSVPAELPMESAAPVPEHSATRSTPHRKAHLDVDAKEPDEAAEAAEPVHEIPAAEMESEPEAEPLPAVVASGQESEQPSAVKPIQRSLFAPITPTAPPRRERPPVSAPPPAAAPSATPAPAPAAPREQRAEQMQFEPVNRGRFEKSEPTIVDGQDLDIPTFLRRNARLR